MGLRVFSVRNDGSYSEVPAIKESFLDGNGAYLIIDRFEKRIYVYRKDGISSILSYSAGRAATNLRTSKGSKYSVVNIEHEERDRVLPELLRKMESESYEEISTSSRDYLPTQAYVYGEKTIPRSRPIEAKTDFIEEPRKINEIKKEINQIENSINSMSYDVEEVVKAFASKILFDTKIENLKNVSKPPRHTLKSELIKKIDDFLDRMYE